MSLTGCFRKMGKNISPENRAAISAAAAEFRAKGMSNDEAAIAAVRAHDGVLSEQVAQLKKDQPKPAQAAEQGGTAVSRAADEVAKFDPDMLIQLEGMDAPMKVGDILAKVREEAASDVRDGKLLEVAAACDLSA